MWKKIDEFAAKLGKWFSGKGDADKILREIGRGSYRTQAWYQSHGGAAYGRKSQGSWRVGDLPEG